MKYRPPNPVNAALRACRSALAIVAAFSLATNLLALASPLYMMQLFDKVLSSRSGDTLVMLTLITAFAVGVLCLLDAIRGQVLVRIGEWLDERLGPTVFGGALGLAFKSDAVARGAGASAIFRRCAASSPARRCCRCSMRRGRRSSSSRSSSCIRSWARSVLAAASCCSALPLLNEFATRQPVAHRQRRDAQDAPARRSGAAQRRGDPRHGHGRRRREAVAGRNGRDPCRGARRRLARLAHPRRLALPPPHAADRDPRRRRLARHQGADEPRRDVRGLLPARARALAGRERDRHVEVAGRRAARLSPPGRSPRRHELGQEGHGIADARGHACRSIASATSRRARTSRRCAACRSTSCRARCSASSAPRPPANRRSRGSSPEPGARPPARCGSTMPTSPSGMPRAAPAISATCRRTSSSSPARCATTSRA